jgi:unsaturated chondroitin disaccharide hydrolase
MQGHRRAESSFTQADVPRASLGRMRAEDAPLAWSARLARIGSTFVLPVLLALFGPLAASLEARTLDPPTQHALDFAAQQLTASVAEVGSPTRFPKSTLADGSWSTEDSGTWTSGFFPGCLWLMFQRTSGSSWHTWAADWTAEMEGEKNDTGSHDVGFKIFCSFGNGYRLTLEPAYRDVVIQGAQSLASRYNPIVGCTRSWDNRHFPVIIDNMMNLEILFWAARNGGNPVWYDMALSHALKTRVNHVRADGSTYQLVDYDPSTGAILGKETVQGYATESTWSRGQAWAVYGFTMAYRETGDSRLLETARLVADYFIDHLPADQVPYWDFEAPNIPNEKKDSSAGAIAASGLLELSTLVSDGASRARYRDAAAAVLTSLCSTAYLAEGTNSSGILLHGVGNKPSNKEVDVSLIYGDYYFIEALLRWQATTTDVPPVFAGYRLEPSVPNPFRTEMRIAFELPRAGPVELRILDIQGAVVRTLARGGYAAGRQGVIWDGTRDDGAPATSGIYFYELRAGGFRQTRKVSLVR